MNSVKEFLNQNHCPKCSDLLSSGNAHGDGFVAGYKYCHQCDEFIEFKTDGLDKKREYELTEFLRAQLKEAEGSKNEEV